MRDARPDDVPPLLDVFARLKSPLLRRVFARDPARYLPQFDVQVYEPGQAVCTFDAPPGGTWIVAEGEVTVARRGLDPDLPHTERRTSGGVFGFDGGPVRADVSARAETRVVAGFLPAARLRSLVGSDPEVARIVAFYAELGGRRAEVARGLRGAAPFRDALPREILYLMEHLDRRAFEAGEVAVAQGDAPSGVYVVLDGELEVVHAQGQATDRLATLGPGGVFGDHAVRHGEPEPSTVRATTPVLCGFVPQAAFFYALVVSPDFRRRAGPRVVASAYGTGLESPGIVAFHGPPEEAARRRLLVRLAAESLAQTYGDRPLLLERGQPGALRTDPVTGVSTLPVSEDPARMRAEARPYAQDYGPLLLLPETSAAPVAHHVTRLVTVDTDVFRRVDDPGLAALATLHATFVNGRGDPRGYPTGTVRLALRPDELDGPASARLADVSPRVREAAARFGRGVTERLVGYALGGGGAWGYAHVALLRALTTGPDALPVDLVGGSSFGALVAAWMASGGLDGLERLVRAGLRLTLATQTAAVAPRALQRWVDHELGGVCLEDLATPLVAVAGDLRSGTEWVPHTGRVGFACRASGAMPPMYPAVSAEGRRLVDGGFVNNVPASAVRFAGAHFVVASNVIGLHTPAEGPGGRMRRLAGALSPRRRAEDTLNASLVLFHTSGLRQSLTADASYAASFHGLDFWNFANARRIVAQTEADPAFPAAVARAKARWKARHHRR